jgi:hypothetical protein
MLLHVVDLPGCASLACAQGLTVGLAAPAVPARPVRALPVWIPAVATPVGFVAIVTLLAGVPGAATAVAGLAVIAVPLLAAIAGARLSRTGRRAWGWVSVPLMVAALLWPDHVAGQLASLGLLVLSCVALGAVLNIVGDARALAFGVAALAVADVVLLLLGPIGAATDALASVHFNSLPGFQQAVVGTSTMGYGDLFVAGVAGAIAARTPGAARRVAVLTLALGLTESILLAGHGPYPSTVPVVVALGIDWAWRYATTRSATGSTANAASVTSPM